MARLVPVSDLYIQRRPKESLPWLAACWRTLGSGEATARRLCSGELLHTYSRIHIADWCAYFVAHQCWVKQWHTGGIRSSWTSTLGAAVSASSDVASRSVRILDSSLEKLQRRSGLQVSSYIISHSLSFYKLSISLWLMLPVLQVVPDNYMCGQLWESNSLCIPGVTAGGLCRLYITQHLPYLDLYHCRLWHTWWTARTEASWSSCSSAQEEPGNYKCGWISDYAGGGQLTIADAWAQVGRAHYCFWFEISHNNFWLLGHYLVLTPRYRATRRFQLLWLLECWSAGGFLRTWSLTQVG